MCPVLDCSGAARIIIGALGKYVGEKKKTGRPMELFVLIGVSMFHPARFAQLIFDQLSHFVHGAFPCTLVFALEWVAPVLPGREKTKGPGTKPDHAWPGL